MADTNFPAMGNTAPLAPTPTPSATDNPIVNGALLLTPIRGAGITPNVFADRPVVLFGPGRTLFPPAGDFSSGRTPHRFFSSTPSAVQNGTPPDHGAAGSTAGAGAAAPPHERMIPSSGGAPSQTGPPPGTSSADVLTRMDQMAAELDTLKGVREELDFCKAQLAHFQSAGASLNQAVHGQANDIGVLQQSYGVLQQQITGALGEVPVVGATTTPGSRPLTRPAATPASTLPRASPPDRSSKGVKLHPPKALSTAALKALGHDARALEIQLDKILFFVCRQPNINFGLREGLMTFMEDPDATAMVDTYLLEHVEREGCPPFNEADFKTAFI